MLELIFTYTEDMAISILFIAMLVTTSILSIFHYFKHSGPDFTKSGCI